MMMDGLIAVGLVAPVAGFFAWVLWKARMPGDPAGARSPRATAGIVAGILAGVLMGPMVLGRLAPEFHRDAFIGDRAAMRVLGLMALEHRAERAALMETGVSAIALDELRAAQLVAIESKREAMHAAANAHRRGLLLWGLVPLTVLAGVGLGVGGFVGRGRGRWVWRGAAQMGKQAGLLVVGSALVGLMAWLFVDRWWAAAVLAAGMSVVGIPVLGARGRAGWGACIAGQVIAAGSVAGSVVLAAAAGWLGGVLGGGLGAGGLGRGMVRAARRAGAGAAYGIALPTAIGLALATIDPAGLRADRSFGWLALVAFLIGGDFRWAGIALGTARDGLGVRWRDAAAQIDRGTGALQALAAASVALLGPMLGLPQAHTIAAALLIGAVTIELGKPIRHAMARSLDARECDAAAGAA